MLKYFMFDLGAREHYKPEMDGLQVSFMCKFASSTELTKKVLKFIMIIFWIISGEAVSAHTNDPRPRPRSAFIFRPTRYPSHLICCPMVPYNVCSSFFDWICSSGVG